MAMSIGESIGMSSRVVMPESSYTLKVDEASIIRTRDVAPVALTTPFVHPSSCIDAFLPQETYTMLPREPQGPTILLEAHMVNDTGCHPHGWSNTESLGPVTYSPAVCPAGWTAHNMKPNTEDYLTEPTHTEFIATCCSSGFHPGTIPHFPTINAVCVKEGSFHMELIGGSGQTTIFSTASYHEPWLMGWKETDVPQLSPEPPNIIRECPEGNHVANWEPATNDKDGSLTCLVTVDPETESKRFGVQGPFDFNDKTNEKEDHRRLPKAAVIIIPCFLGLCGLGCLFLLFWRWMKNRQQRVLAKKGGY